MRTPLKSAIALSAVVLVAFGAAGCGDDDSSSSDDNTDSKTTSSEPADTSGSTDTGGSEDTAGAEVVEITVKEGELQFSTDQLDAKAGKVTFKFTNPDSISHDFRIEQDGEDVDGTDLISNGDSDEFTVDLEAGDYDFYCSPHKSAGMKGKLTVT